MDSLMAALTQVFQPYNLLIIFSGTLFGILVGAMPGLSSIMGLAIIMPFTFSIGGISGILMLLGVFCGAIYGGSITAILINTPGTANSAATVLDGYPMATKLGQPGRALSISTTASTFGGLFSAVCLLWISPILAQFALKFGSPEYFALAVFGLSIVTSISSQSVVKGLIGATLGLLLATVGMDGSSGAFRFTFGSVYLTGGISFVPMLIALYAFAQGMNATESGEDDSANVRKNVKLDHILPTRSDLRTCFPTFLRSSVLGTLIGAIPGTGGDIACWVGYNEAKRWSKHPEEFGHGAPEGIAGPEAANNAISGGALIPLLTLGIPGDAGTAVMLGALMMQGITPGPLLFTEQTTNVYLIIFGMFMANVAMCILGFCGIRFFSKIAVVPSKILTPTIFIFCFIGTYAMNHNINDIFLMIIAGVVAYLLIKLDFAMPPIILGLILGNLVEKNLRKSLILSSGSASIFFTRPISCVLLAIAAASVILSLLQPVWRQKKAQKD